MISTVRYLIVVWFLFSAANVMGFGTLDNTVWVSPAGNNGNDGFTQNTAVKTISAGISIAMTNNISDVKIIAGTYNEVVTLQAGVNLYGGYTLGSLDQNATTNQVIISGVNGATYGSVVGLSIAKETIINGLRINGCLIGGSTGNNIAVYLRNSSGITFQNVEIYGGTAGNGANGSSGNNQTVAAASGSAGTTAQRFSTSCDDSAFSGGSGASGATALQKGYDGGDGGKMDYNCPAFLSSDYDATNGQNGSKNPYFTPASGTSLGGTPCGTGADGDFKDGTVGADGSNASTGGFSAGSYMWIPGTGTDGSNGNPGYGGNGGGGGG
ncbi:MAG: hypothetical protein RIE86_00300, partial [Imperialibacter sp.]